MVTAHGDQRAAIRAPAVDAVRAVPDTGDQRLTRAGSIELRSATLRFMPTRPPDRPTAVVFDLGGVLIDWNPRHLYRRLFDDEAEMERFLAEVVSPAWNLEQDRGRPFADGIAELIRRHPDRADLIEMFWSRWIEMLGEPFPESVAVLEELDAAGVRLFALTNWSAETFALGAPRLPFLERFEAVLVSGDVKLVKPDPAIFQLLVDRHGLEPARTLFIDDMRPNVDAAAALGFRAIQFSDAPSLRRTLVALDLLPA
jgi:2-haloacid dehalogenase